MAMRIKGLTNADAAYKYFLEHYYKPGEERGFWHGTMRERLELGRTITKEDFRAILRNELPGHPGQTLTQRQNKTRLKTVWEKDEFTKAWIEVERQVSNHRLGTDCTFSLTKELSTYLEKTNDPVVYAICRQALLERLNAIELDMQTRVRKGGAQENRLTASALWAVFEDLVGRPVDGQSDPHRHWHCILPNATWDAVEEEIKAAELEKLYNNHAGHEALFHARINEILLEQNYGFRRNTKGVMELTLFYPDECRVLCKRTTEIEKLAAKQHREMMIRATAIVEAAAKNGLERDVTSEYAKLKDELGEKCRSGKGEALYKAGTPEFHRTLAKQFATGRWEEFTPENARNGDRINFLTPDRAEEFTIKHAFERKSQIRDGALNLIKVACSFCEGAMTTAEIQAFCATDPRFVRSPKTPGMVTTAEILVEEQKIQNAVIETKDRYTPLAKDRSWKVQDAWLDEKQLAAVKLIVETPDLAIAIPGLTGSGKSRTIKEASIAIRELTRHAPVVLAPKGKNAISLKEHTGGEAWTIADYKANPKVHVHDSVIFCDEFSQVGNEDCQWLLDHCIAHRNRIAFFGDETQYQGISRGDPISDLLDAGIIEFRHLDKIYRQKPPSISRTLRDEITLLCRDAHAANWLPRGRVAKYFSASTTGILLARSVTIA